MPRTDDFFRNPQSAASAIKTKIVVNYFKPWARIMANVVRSEPDPRLLYLDLFSGPGKFENGTPSTPLQILQHAIATPDLCKMLVPLFNDEDAELIGQLRRNIAALPGIEKLKHQPRLRAGEVDRALVERLRDIGKIPTFSFVDPFGYRGLSLKLVDVLVKGWGSDLILFFSFNSINRALGNPLMKKHVDALFGDSRAKELGEAVKTAHAAQREELLIEKFIEAVNDHGYGFVIPYVFEQDNKDRTSHYLIFISKNKRGFGIMKRVMYTVSEERNQGVARFGYVRSVSKKRTPLLALLNTPLDDLGEQVCEEFAGARATWRQLSDQYDDRYPRNPFVDKNWRTVMLRLEEAGRVFPDIPRDKRLKRNGESTFSDRILVRIPPKEKK
jgi:three-Cys-motif partner protein